VRLRLPRFVAERPLVCRARHHALTGDSRCRRLSEWLEFSLRLALPYGEMAGSRSELRRQDHLSVFRSSDTPADDIAFSSTHVKSGELSPQGRREAR